MYEITGTLYLKNCPWESQKKKHTHTFKSNKYLLPSFRLKSKFLMFAFLIIYLYTLTNIIMNINLVE